MFLLDDLLARPLLSILDAIQTVALHEYYDLEAIRNDLKEAELLHDIGELSDEEYRERKERLEAELELAEQVHERLSEGKIRVIQ